MNDTSANRGGRPHDLNNIFCKILGAAELALDQPCSAEVRRELETIMDLAEKGGAVVSVELHTGPGE